jgi:hypothetical protein
MTNFNSQPNSIELAERPGKSKFVDALILENLVPFEDSLGSKVPTYANFELSDFRNPEDTEPIGMQGQVGCRALIVGIRDLRESGYLDRSKGHMDALDPGDVDSGIFAQGCEQAVVLMTTKVDPITQIKEARIIGIKAVPQAIISEARAITVGYEDFRPHYTHTIAETGEVAFQDRYRPNLVDASWLSRVALTVVVDQDNDGFARTRVINGALGENNVVKAPKCPSSVRAIVKTEGASHTEMLHAGVAEVVQGFSGAVGVQGVEIVPIELQAALDSNTRYGLRDRMGRLMSEGVISLAEYRNITSSLADQLGFVVDAVTKSSNETWEELNDWRYACENMGNCVSAVDEDIATFSPMAYNGAALRSSMNAAKPLGRKPSSDNIKALTGVISEYVKTLEFSPHFYGMKEGEDLNGSFRSMLTHVMSIIGPVDAFAEKSGMSRLPEVQTLRASILQLTERFAQKQ